METSAPSQCSKEEAKKAKARERAKAYYYANLDKVKAYAKEYRQKNKEKAREYSKEYREKNREVLCEVKRAYYQKNKERMRAYWKSVSKDENRVAIHNEVSAKRRANKGKGALWGKFETRFLYRLCRTISKATGIPHHVDHVFPLFPRDHSFCGLHVPENLRIVPAIVNCRKHRQVPIELMPQQ